MSQILSPTLPRTIYDFDFTTAPTDAGMADGATKSFSGITWTFHKGTNTAGTIDSNGLNIVFSGVPSLESIFSFPLASLGIDVINSRYRISIYHDVVAATAGQNAIRGCYLDAVQGVAPSALVLGGDNYNSGGTVIARSGFNTIVGTTISASANFTAATATIIDMNGGLQTVRQGAYSGGFPDISATYIQTSSVVASALFSGTTTGITSQWYMDLYAQCDLYVATPVTIRFKRIKIELL